MNDLSLNKIDQVYSDDNSSSFVLDQYSDEINQDEHIQYGFDAVSNTSNIYRKDFYYHFHTNYYGELENEGPFLASVRYISSNEDQPSISSLEDTNDHQTIRAIIRTSKDNYNVSESSDLVEEVNLLQRLIDKAHLSNIQHCKIVQYIKANEKIYQFDKENDERQCYKIGIIYQNSNQSNENEILSNNQLSSEMENFLNLIADRIQLKDFQNYRGDLDTKSNFHGEYSYFRIYNNYQIMFNIAPMIPTDTHDQLFIQRKSLVANSFICIVFQQDNSIFQPNFFEGKVIHVYITVQPITIDHELFYKIRIWRRSHIRSIIDPGGGMYKHNQLFRNIFLRLVHNTMNIILEKGLLHSKIVEQKQRLKSEELIQLFSTFSLHSKFDDRSSHSKNWFTDYDSNSKTNSTIKNTNHLHLLKHHHSGVSRRFSEAFHKLKPIFNVSVSDSSLPNLTEIQTVSTKLSSRFSYKPSLSKSTDDHSQLNSTEFDQKNFGQSRNLSIPSSTFDSTLSDPNIVDIEKSNTNKSQLYNDEKLQDQF